MRPIRLWTTPLALLAALTLLAAGCTAPPSGDKGKADAAKTEDKGHAHDHPSEGPHHGAIAEWGNEDYHVEFTVDRSKTEVVAYILGKDAKTASPIKADRVEVTLKDPVAQIELKPVPQAGDPPGTASRFVGPLPEPARKVRKLTGTVSGVVDGKPYAGDFTEIPPHGHGDDQDKK